jgi:hypothetical protein
VEGAQDLVFLMHSNFVVKIVNCMIAQPCHFVGVTLSPRGILF